MFTQLSDMQFLRIRPLLHCLGACFFLWLAAQPLAAQLTADFSATPQSGCLIVVSAFQDQSTGNPVSWEWTFTRGGTVVGTLNGQNPGRIFSGAGCYDVRLVVANAAGVTDTLTRPCYIEVFPNPVPSFTSNVTSGCAPLTVNFTNTTQANSASISTNTWVFRNRATGVSVSSSQTDPVVTFTDPGRYDVQLRVINSNGCDTTITVFNQVEVSNSPIGSFNLQGTSGCVLPVNVNVTNTTQANGATGITYQWDFPGGTPAVAIGANPPLIQYNVAGAYTATMIATAASGCADTVVTNFNVTSGRPNAGFTVSAPTACQNVAVLFQDTTLIGVGGTSQWDFGDGSSGTGRSVSHAYVNTGTFQIRLIASSGQGCSDTAFSSVTVVGNPTALFSFTPSLSCDVNQVFQFTDQSSAGVVSWAWTMGDGGTSILQNPFHSYGNAGSYEVCLTVTDGNGCRNTFCSPDSADIITPTSSLIATVTRGCAPLSTVLSSNSVATDPITAYQWTLGDGTGTDITPGTATTPTVNATVNTPGDYDIRLIITTASGCMDTFTRAGYIRAGSPPNVSFTVSNDSACVDEIVDFRATPNRSDWDYQWNYRYPTGNWVIDGANTSFAYPDTGCFDVALVAEDRGCQDTVVIPNAICVFPPLADFSLSDSAVCTLPATITITDNSIGPITSYRWLLNGNFVSANPSLPSITLPALTPPGNYTVTLEVTNNISGCVSTTTQAISVGNPNAGFSLDRPLGCRDHTVQFTNLATQASVERWFFGDGNGNNRNANPVHTYRDTGLFDVTLIVIDPASGCRDTATQTAAVRVNGIGIDFTATPDKGCVPHDVSFLSTSQAAFGATVTSLTWDFGDPNNPATSTLANPSHTYSRPGFYTVTLRATDSNGCVDTLVRQNAVQATQPIASFTFDKDTTCFGDVIRFNNLSVGAGLEYSWIFGPAPTDTSSLRNPIWMPSFPGNQSIALIIRDSIGCADTTVQINAIFIDTLVVDFDGNPRQGTCPPHAVTFSNLSMGDIAQVIWDFGDGTTSFEPNPQHIYTTAGCFDVKLTVIHTNGCVDSLVQPCFIDIVGPRAQIIIDNPILCLGDTAVVRVITDSVATVIFDADDGPLQVDPSPVNRSDTVEFKHFYAISGSYDPIVVVIDQRGCQVPLPSAIPIRVIQPPTASIAAVPDAGCAAFTTTLNDLTVLGDTSIATWEWDFDDTNTSNQQNPVHTFINTGVYSVFLQVTDEFGCIDSARTSVFVTPAPTASFIASDTFTCAPASISFTDQSLGAGIQDWIWDFGDGTVIQGQQNPTHQYDQNGLYDVRLIVFDRNNCSDTLLKSQYINLRKPTAYVYANDPSGCSPITLTFFGDSAQILSDTTIASYTWLVETPAGVVTTITNIDSLDQNYNLPGTYDLGIIVQDIFGCRDTLIRPDYLNLQPTLIPGELDITYASVLARDTSEIVFEPFGNASQFRNYQLYWESPRNSGNYIPIDTLNNINDTRFVHEGIVPDNELRPHRYKVLVENICRATGDINATNAHRTVKVDVSPMLDTLRLDWNAYEGWQPDAYEINLAFDYDPFNMITIDTVLGNQLFYIDGANTFCYEDVSYRVRALRQLGGVISSFSNIDSMFPLHNQPEEPIHVAAASVFADSSIDVSWLPYQGYGPSYYVIGRSGDGTAYNIIDTVRASQLIYRDTDVEVDEKFYYYNVHLRDTCGDRTPEGRYGRSILLEVSTENNFPELAWTQYEDWPNGVLTYDIEVFDPELAAFRRVTSVGKDVKRYVDEETFIRDGEYCYRIRAIEANGVNEAYSNEDCTIFSPRFYTPNAFTPNDDGKNDRFYVVAPGVRSLTLEIYDRWGKLIFETTDLEGGWDGTYKGKAVPEGVYVFRLTGTGTNGTKVNTAGSITLIR
ncbi:MAG: PKD domain-containing protein [Bacteroidia bacterium]